MKMTAQMRAIRGRVGCPAGSVSVSYHEIPELEINPPNTNPRSARYGMRRWLSFVGSVYPSTPSE